MTIYKGFSTFNRYKKYRLTDYELAKQDLFNHFQIRKGEKLMNPGFGSEIWDLLFEPFTEEIKQRIVADIETVVRYDPRISVDSVLVTQFEYGIQVELSLTYIPTNQTELLMMQFDQKS
jgi:phage baseplate assembly protein W